MAIFGKSVPAVIIFYAKKMVYFPTVCNHYPCTVFKFTGNINKTFRKKNRFFFEVTSSTYTEYRERGIAYSFF